MARQFRPRRVVAGMAGAMAAARDLARARKAAEEAVQLDPRAVPMAKDIFSGAERYVKARRTYQRGHPARERFFDEVLERITEYLATFDDLLVRLEPDTVHLEYEVIYKVDRVDQNIWYPLYRDGVREVQITRGLEPAELDAFFESIVEMLMPHVSEAVGEEDDAVTMLWDADLEHISYAAIDALSEVEDDSMSAHHAEEVRAMVTASVTREISKLDVSAGAGSVGRAVQVAKRMRSVTLANADLSFLNAENLSALEEIEATTETSDELVYIERWERMLLADGLANDPLVIEKFMEASIRSLLLVRGSMEDVRILAGQVEHFYDAIIEQGMFARATKLRCRIEATLSEDSSLPLAVLELVDRAMASERALDSAHDALATAGENDPEVDDVLAFLHGVSGVSALSLLAGMGRIPNPAIRRRLCDLCVEWGQPALDAAERALAAATDTHASDLLDIVGRIGGAPAAKVVQSALRHPDAAVRAAALGVFLNMVTPVSATTHARSALRDTDARVRAVALDYVVRHHIDGAIQLIRERIGHESFGVLDLEEKQRLFVAYAQIGGEPSNKWLLQQLAQRNLLGNNDVDEVRIAAAHALGAVGYEAARDTLDKVSRSRFARAPVRQACVEALANLASVARTPTPRPQRKAFASTLRYGEDAAPVRDGAPRPRDGTPRPRDRTARPSGGAPGVGVPPSATAAKETLRGSPGLSAELHASPGFRIDARRRVERPFAERPDTAEPVDREDAELDDLLSQFIHDPEGDQ